MLGKHSSLILVGGHVIECFDNTLYGFLAVFLSELFFPNSSREVEILASYGVFAAGFLARPLGALLFGYIGDKKGRRLPLIFSMALVGIPTCLIGLLPTYDRIGLAAPIILVICRLFQGLMIGGEFSAANLYISENVAKDLVGRNTGILVASGMFGAVLATLIGAIMTQEFMPSWGWRVPFLLGGLSAFVIYLLRKNMPETAAFSSLQKQHKVSSVPWKVLLKSYKKNVVLGVLLGGMMVIPLYCATILGSKILKKFGYSDSQTMLFHTVSMILDGFALIGFGYLADKVTFPRQVKWGVWIIVVVAIPAFYAVSHPDPAFIRIVWFIFALVIGGAVMNGGVMPYISNQFPTHCRFSGTAISVTVGGALFGGTTPFVCAYLIDTYKTNMAPTVWVIALSLLTLMMMSWVKRSKI